MSYYSVGLTSSGREILISQESGNINDIAEIFCDFDEIDKLEAILALEFLLLREKRRTGRAKAWGAGLLFPRNFLVNQLGARKTRQLKQALGIKSAFEARDYGRKIVHSHFRDMPH